MGGINRAQFSLIVNDSEMFDNLIIPLKANKQLKPLVEKLLMAYYYDATVRELIDGEEQVSGGSDKIKELFDDARNNLLAWEILSDNLGTTLEEGAVKMQEMASSGMGVVVEDEGFGTPLVKVNLPKQEKEISTERTDSSSPDKQETERLTNLESQMQSMMQMMQNVLLTVGNTQHSTSIASQSSQAVDENVTQVSQVEGFKSDALGNMNFTNNNVQQAETAPTVHVEEAKPVEPVKPKIDGRSALTGLLGSL